MLPKHIEKLSEIAVNGYVKIKTITLHRKQLTNNQMQMNLIH